MTATSRLRELLAGPSIVVAPGVYDALGALLAEGAGFAAAYLSGAAIAYTRFGRPDVGLVGMSEVAAVLGTVSERVDLPLVVDADTGFGNALNVTRTVRLFEREGASAVQIEDQTLPKRCGHLGGKSLVPVGEMTGKIKAALDARASDDTLVIARTDAIAVEGMAAALRRAEAYHAAGADLLFVEAPESRAQLAEIAARLAGLAPLVANMVEGGRTPFLSAGELEDMGFALVIFPGGLVRAFAHMARDYFATLRRDGTTGGFRDRMLDFSALNDLVGGPDLLAAGKRYDDPEPSDADG